MYIYQNGKLYVQNEDNVLVGVEIYPDKGVFRIDGTETKLEDVYEVCTPYEARCRFNITIETPYIFPKETIEVTEDEPVVKAKRTYQRRGK